MQIVVAIRRISSFDLVFLFHSLRSKNHIVIIKILSFFDGVELFPKNSTWISLFIFVRCDVSIIPFRFFNWNTQHDCRWLCFRFTFHQTKPNQRNINRINSIFLYFAADRLHSLLLLFILAFFVCYEDSNVSIGVSVNYFHLKSSLDLFFSSFFCSTHSIRKQTNDKKKLQQLFNAQFHGIFPFSDSHEKFFGSKNDNCITIYVNNLSSCTFSVKKIQNWTKKEFDERARNKR